MIDDRATGDRQSPIRRAPAGRRRPRSEGRVWGLVGMTERSESPLSPDERSVLDGLGRRERQAVRRVLVSTAASCGRAVDRAHVQEAVDAAPMAAVPAAARLHRLSGSVLSGLDAIDGVPESALADLARVRRETSFHHLLVTATMARIGAEFDRADLAWVVIKGPVAASLLYPEPSDRSYGDLDLLVARTDFPVAVRILEELGFEHSMRNWALAERMSASQIGMSGANVDVDLHWHLHYSDLDRRPFALDPHAMIDRRRWVNVSGVDVPTLDPVDTLLTLAFHAARSDGHRLIWLKDVERSVAVEAPDLDTLVVRALEQRVAPPVGIVLDRARAVLDADVPARVVADMVPGSLRVGERVTRRLVDPVQLDERTTITRLVARSARATTWQTVASVPPRVLRMLRDRRSPPIVNETDDPDEKASYLASVANG